MPHYVEQETAHFKVPFLRNSTSINAADEEDVPQKFVGSYPSVKFQSPFRGSLESIEVRKRPESLQTSKSIEQAEEGLSTNFELDCETPTRRFTPSIEKLRK